MIVTNGSMQSAALTVPGVGELRVTAPGLRLTAYAAPRPGNAAPDQIVAYAAPAGDLDARGTYGELSNALGAHGIREYGDSAVASAVPADTGAMQHSLRVGKLHAPHVQLEVPAPSAGEGVLLMIDDGVAPILLPPARFERSGAAGPSVSARAFGADGDGQPTQLRFYVPAGLLSGLEPVAPADPLAVQAEAWSGVKRAVLRFFRFAWVGELLQAGVDAVVAWLAEHVEKRHKTEGLRALAPEFPLLAPADVQARLAGKGRALLLVHGIFSSARVAFTALASHQALRAHLAGVYGDRIFAWDHFTVSKGTLSNARELLAALPPGCDVDVVCHSRGAVVTRAALEHPELSAERARAFRHVRKVMFVAGAHRGSALARWSNIDKLLNTFSLAGLAGGGVVLEVVVAVLKLLAHGVAELPGIRDMDPERSAVLAAINGPGMTPVQKYLAVRANFGRARSFASRLIDLGTDLVFAEANDLVVPFAGASGWDEHVLAAEGVFVSEYGTPNAPQNLVHHTNFFSQPGMIELMMQELHA